jgi:hypothetical protein
MSKCAHSLCECLHSIMVRRGACDLEDINMVFELLKLSPSLFPLAFLTVCFRAKLRRIV